jgi:hypothetical protein
MFEVLGHSRIKVPKLFLVESSRPIEFFEDLPAEDENPSERRPLPLRPLASRAKPPGELRLGRKGRQGGQGVILGVPPGAPF